MGQMKNKVMDMENDGLLYYDDNQGCYETTKLGKLVEERDFLEWEIKKDKADLIAIIHKINKLTGGRNDEVQGL